MTLQRLRPLFPQRRPSFDLFPLQDDYGRAAAGLVCLSIHMFFSEVFLLCSFRWRSTTAEIKMAKRLVFAVGQLVAFHKITGVVVTQHEKVFLWIPIEPC